MYNYGNYEVDLDNIPIIPENRKYWLVRADGGKFFEDFLKNSYIGIRYNSITKRKIESCIIDGNFDKEVLKKHIKISYPDESRPGLVAGYIYTMCYIMKKGDIVVVPSENAENLIIGEIESNETIFLTKSELRKKIENDIKNGILISNYGIRKQVKWVKRIHKADMDMRFYKALFSHNTISSISEYDFIIDKLCFPYYIKNGKFNFMFQITSSDDVNFSFYYKLYEALQCEIIELRNDFKNLNTEDADKLISKIQVESPGYIVLSSLISKSNNLANFLSDETSISLIGLLQKNEDFIPVALIALLIIASLCGTKITYKDKKRKLKIETKGLFETINKLIQRIYTSNDKHKELKNEIKELRKEKKN